MISDIVDGHEGPHSSRHGNLEEALTDFYSTSGNIHVCFNNFMFGGYVK
jgi:hypothetical protein